MSDTTDSTGDPFAVILARLDAIESRLTTEAQRTPETIAAEADADVARIEAQADADVARMEAAAEAEAKIAGAETDSGTDSDDGPDHEAAADAQPALDHPYFRPWGRRP